MNKREKRKAINEFIDRWTDRGDEKQDAQRFWVDLLQSVLEIPNATKVIRFEDAIKLGKKHHGFIDGYIPSTKVLIEQKGYDIDLDKPQKQSDGQILTPYEQAKRYADQLSYDDRPRWIVVSNFRELRIHDMNKPQDDPEVILLQLLDREAHRLEFLVDREKVLEQRELEVSLQAGELVGKLYDALEKQFEQPMSDHDYVSLNKLCVRLVFCLYAEDAGLFGDDQFHSYLKEQSKLGLQRLNFALKTLFQMLNTKESDRDPDADPSLLAFPYVNGGLFADDKSRIPRFSEEVFDLLVNKASAGFDWSEISPTIFGAVFESTLNKETRRQGGMHYTSITNIHKVIDPLFLDDIKAEFAALKKKVENSSRVTAAQAKEIQAFQKKIASLTFLDPACGSGNFLTETYLSLRKIENEALDLLYGGQQSFSAVSPIQVNIDHFYGIEINDFAVVVAKTALWIAESQMMKATEDIVHDDLDFLPLKSAAHIVEGNALRLDWGEVTGANKIDYVIGNPPFVGHQHRNPQQQEDMEVVFNGSKESYGKVDYVGAWFEKGAQYIQGSKSKCAFVATNSICQGECVAALWRNILINRNIEILFAYDTFKWVSEASDMAAVHCVIVGFWWRDKESELIKKRIYHSDGSFSQADIINGYLSPAPVLFIESRGSAISQGIPKITKGSQPTDDGNLFLTQEEFDALSAKDKNVAKLVRQFYGAREFINNTKRYCFWLKGVSPHLYSKNKEITGRIERIKEFRLNSPTESVRKDAEKSHLFTQIRQPECDYLLVPRHSGEGRNYIPIGFVSKEIICGDANYLIPTDSLFVFGILVSKVHMAWMRTVAGRLEMRYRYTPAVYNTFPWKTDLSEKQRERIENTAQEILDARKAYPDASLFELYGTSMPEELLKAHRNNDRAVMAAYGFKSTMTEPEIVAELFKMYQARTDEIAAEERRKAEEVSAAKKKSRARKKKDS